MNVCGQVKLLDKMMHAQAEVVDQQVVVLSQVLASEVNIGYEEILNTQVGGQPRVLARWLQVQAHALGVCMWLCCGMGSCMVTDSVTGRCAVAPASMA